MNNKSDITVSSTADDQSLYTDIKRLVVEARSSVVKQVNQTLTVTYWQIGKRINIEILQSKRADYGDATIKRLAESLTSEFGQGFGYRNLMRMTRFYEQFSDQKIVTTLSAKLRLEVGDE